MEDAIKWVVELFQGMHEIDGKPKVFHSLRVGCLLNYAKENDQVIVGGFLHDVLEETKAAYEDVETKFGKEVAKLVLACSYDQSLYLKNRNDAFNKLLYDVRQCGRDAVAIKAADIMDNITSVPASTTQHEDILKKRALDWLELCREFLGLDHSLTIRLEDVVVKNNRQLFNT